jgi:hypothetical protein
MRYLDLKPMKMRSAKKNGIFCKDAGKFALLSEEGSEIAKRISRGVVP